MRIDRVIFDAEELNRVLCQAVALYIGDAAYVCNFKNTIEALLDDIVSPNGQTSFSHLERLDLSDGQINDVIKIATRYVKPQLEHHFASTIGVNTFVVEFAADNSVHVVDHGFVPEDEFSYNKLIKKQTLKDMDDGHYVPERVRQRIMGY